MRGFVPAYAIAATPRVGSFLLCEALTSSGSAGRPGEPLIRADPEWSRRGWGSYEEYLDAFIRNSITENGVFGVKLMWLLHEQLRLEADSEPGFLAALLKSKVKEALDGPKWVYMRREDKVAQAVSWAIARQTGKWSSLAHSDVRPDYNRDQIDWCYRRILYEDALWREFFSLAGVAPYELTYEKFAKDPIACANNIMDWLQVAPAPGSRRLTVTLRKQADTVNEKWIARFRAACSV